MNDLRPAIETALKAFSGSPLRDAGLDLLSTLGYASDRTLDLDGTPGHARRGRLSPWEYLIFLRGITCSSSWINNAP